MKTCGLACTFLLLAVAMGLPGRAQQRGTVGVSLTLKPTQTIRVDVCSHRDSTVRNGTPADYRQELVTGFGTSRYGVSVDRITADSLGALKGTAMGHASIHSHPKADVPLDGRRKDGRPRHSDRPPVIYSIHVN